ncbi:hypothetical protein J6590_010986 [Homalodisca vitripennis]|nr:hypothetical protein J6590_010986 [Homalodisca vitripennis]
MGQTIYLTCLVERCLFIRLVPDLYLRYEYCGRPRCITASSPRRDGLTPPLYSRPPITSRFRAIYNQIWSERDPPADGRTEVAAHMLARRRRIDGRESNLKSNGEQE